MSEMQRIFVSVPEHAVTQPLIYEMITKFGVVPNIRRVDVEDTRGWMILELRGTDQVRGDSIAYLESQGCVVDDMTGDIVAG